MVQKHSSFKHCATCDGWCGNRQVDYHRSHVLLTEEYQEGQCTIGNWNRATKKQGNTCSNWKKWSMLK